MSSPQLLRLLTLPGRAPDRLHWPQRVRLSDARGEQHHQRGEALLVAGDEGDRRRRRPGGGRRPRWCGTGRGHRAERQQDGECCHAQRDAATKAPIRLDWSGVGATSGAAALVVLLATAASLPLLRRLSTPTGLRNEQPAAAC